ncbi:MULTISPECIES: DUF58 domain-containing protein [Gordonia]|uniref:DUF58 domain-containing protein n=1 Tax=Gordonia amicalis TaxID=89053 RepID=A0AAE4R733_9ACTN|nr:MULTISPECIES: DUF58 domain-containing protein [Gordonia]ATD72734.1 DUF58 domain-containing protein [Gordonia sp. 1D]KAF0971304.1 hypothetical protein BPODLACK_00490 [Gordonia sp. YY1]MCZ0915362.1 DUF58 domain-containing protein [Gordonia amicalis]MCZ4651002.1 DUF58 domain-containing protein [Gordonia amicalis]MDJ0453078.1 DUF58 domain-containing protein [Gordonia amicalis]
MFLTGRFLVLVLLGAVPILVWPNYAVPVLWVLFCVLLMCLDLALAGSTKTITMTRSVIGPVRLGESTSCSITVTNTGTGTFRGVLRDSWQPSAGATGAVHRLIVPRGETTTVTTTLTPTRRGDRLAVRVTVRRLGPLGLAGRQRSVPLPGRVRALPPFGSRRLLPSRLAHLRQLDGRSAVRIRGQGTEFDSLRDYVEGDDVRSIDWRATARRRSTVVRTWQPEKDRHIVIVLDTSRTSAGRVGDVPRLDAAMDAALLLAALASHAGDRVDLIAGDRRVHRRVVGEGRTTLLSRLVTAMADLEPALLEADWPMLGAEVAKISRQRALLVLLTPMEPAAVEESLLPPLSVLAQRYKVVIGSVADPALEEMIDAREDPEAVYDAAAAARTVTLRNRTATAVGRLGVDVVDAPPDTLPARLADHYLLLKSRGLL